MTKSCLFVLLVLLSTACVSAKADPRNLLSHGVSLEQVKSQLLPPGSWHPYPTIAERERWNTVPEKVRMDCIRKAEDLLKTGWQSLPATLFLQFEREGNRSNYERASFSRREKLVTLVLAEVFENKGRFLDEIADGVWAICEETYWGVRRRRTSQKRGTGLPDVEELLLTCSRPKPPACSPGLATFLATGSTQFRRSSEIGCAWKSTDVC